MDILLLPSPLKCSYLVKGFGHHDLLELVALLFEDKFTNRVKSEAVLRIYDVAGNQHEGRLEFSFFSSRSIASSNI